MCIIQSPFTPQETLLLSPVVAKGMSLFLYKPDALTEERDSEYMGDTEPYGICFKSTQGTIGIHTATEEFYQQALAYLCHLYPGPSDEDEECFILEC